MAWISGFVPTALVGTTQGGGGRLRFLIAPEIHISTLLRIRPNKREKDAMPNCIHCERDFYAKRRDAKYCSDACRKADKRGISPDKMSEVIIPDTITPDSLRAQANKLVALQRKTLPYRLTPENEERAAQIIDLRKRAAHLEHPITA